MAACGASDSSGEVETGGAEPEPELVPAPGGVRRLLGRQYIATIDQMLGPAAAAAAEPPRDFPLHDFDAIGAAELSLSDTDIEQYELSAFAVAKAAVQDRAALAQLAPCVAESAPDDACYTQVAQRVGHMAFRRPLEAAELARLAKIGVDARVWGDDDFATGLEYELVAILQSPHFLYVAELGETVQPEGAEPVPYRVLRPNERLTRMSLFFQGRTPSLADLEDVERDGLDDAQAEALAWEMVNAPVARTNLSYFFDELYRLREVAGVAKDTSSFPEFSVQLGETMRAETLRMIATVIWEQDDDALAILDAPFGFVNDELAAVYGVPAPGSQSLVRVDYPPEQGRAGVLGQAAFLSRHAHPAKTSPTRRGLFIQTKVLCFDVPPPPPGVDTSIPEDDGEPKTLREKLQVHMENPDCRACHSLMDPLGFGLEHYDPIGRYRTHEPNGLPIDAQTEVTGLGTYGDAAGLGSLLRDHPLVSNCMVRNIVRNGLGHIESEGEEATLDYLDETWVANGRNMRELLVHIATSQLFSRVGEPK